MNSFPSEHTELAGAKKAVGSSPETRRPVSSRQYGQVTITLFLLAVFGLAVLCVGIGLTWFAKIPH
jgi:hypothetical protein